MRVMMLLTAMVFGGCANQPSTPTSGDTPAQTSASAAVLPGASDTDPEAQRLALAKKLHLKVVNQDGEEVYCKINMVTGSHIRTDTHCFTAQELDHVQKRTDNDLDQLFKPYTPAGQGTLSPGRQK
jgi:hypothetical protein